MDASWSEWDAAAARDVFQVSLEVRSVRR